MTVDNKVYIVIEMSLRSVAIQENGSNEEKKKDSCSKIFFDQTRVSLFTKKKIIDMYL